MGQKQVKKEARKQHHILSARLLFGVFAFSFLEIFFEVAYRDRIPLLVLLHHPIPSAQLQPVDAQLQPVDMHLRDFGVLDDFTPVNNNETFCVPWSISSDNWWTHHVDWEVTEENDTHYCFSPIKDVEKASLFRELYQVQFQSDCSNATNKNMWSSGWGADFLNVVDGLLYALETKQPMQMFHQSGWHYAAMKDNSRPVCPLKSMYCYFLNMTRCEPSPKNLNTGFVAKATAGVRGKPSRWLLDYATRPQTMFRHEIYQYSTTAINITTPCTAIHVRQADIVLHGKHSRQYYPIEAYINLSSSFQPEHNILLLTDDQNAIGEALHKFPKVNWMYLDRPRHKGAEGGWEQQIPSHDPKHEVKVLMSTFRLVRQCNSLIYAPSSFADYLAGEMEAAADQSEQKELTFVNIGSSTSPFTQNYTLSRNISRAYPNRQSRSIMSQSTTKDIAGENKTSSDNRRKWQSSESKRVSSQQTRENRTAPYLISSLLHSGAPEQKQLVETKAAGKQDASDIPATATATATATVAYVISVTGCGKDPITDSAAVLKHSIHRASIQGTLGSRYDYELYATYHPDAQACAAPLKGLGYKLLKRKTFVNVEDIQGEDLRRRIANSGCCGEKELIKFEAYTLTDYPIVVHLDLDVLILQPMDDIFDMMMFETDDGAVAVQPSKAIMWPDKPLPKRINAFFTYDYGMINPGHKYKPVQGGFLVLRPSLAVYEEFKNIVTVGDFRGSEGWGGVTGIFWGSVTFQGLVPYYYDVLHPGQSVELSNCVYNQMCSIPRKPGKEDTNGTTHMECLTGEEECEDCRERPLEDIVSAHFTICGKPWECEPHGMDDIQNRLCRKLFHEWYKARSELEQSWGRSGRGNSSWEGDQFFGYCKHAGRAGYRRIKEPYGKPTEEGAPAMKVD